jgi:hypothetical protein
MVAALALGGGATSTHALDGVSGEHPDTEGVFRTACQSLRTQTNLPGGDEIYACDSDGEQCRLFSVTDEGTALGFCENTLGVVPDRGGVLEKHVSIDATTFGGDIGVAGSARDIFCQTFENTATATKGKTTPSPGKKVCVRVFPVSGNCPRGACGAGDGSIVVRRDTCIAVRQILAASVTSDASQNIAWWLFSDSKRTGLANSEVLSVCPGFGWEFLPLSDPIGAELTAKYQAGRYAIKTPHIVYYLGVRYCKIVTGESPLHTCP